MQFRRVSGRDSSQVVTPFVQVGTYPTRNFALRLLHRSIFAIDGLIILSASLRRRRARTISSSRGEGRRMVSEDPPRRASRVSCWFSAPSHCHCPPRKWTSSSGYSGFPAYSRLRTATSPSRGAAPFACQRASYLRTVIVTAAVYWRFSSKLRPCGLTSPLNVPAPGRRQWVYSALRLRTHLCF
jgi:hypothetical protein